MKITAPCVVAMPSEDYHRDPAPLPSLSSTLARLIINRSPLHAWTAHPRLNPEWEPTDRKTFDIGRAAHRSLLGRGSDYAPIPEDLLASNGAASTKEAKAFISDCRASGVTPLKNEEVALIGRMAEVAQAKLDRMRIALDPERSELSAFAQIDGVWCRAQIDNAPADPKLPLYDFKTCEDASPEACIRAVTGYGYDVQAAHYLDVWHAATGQRRGFRFIFQEKSPPYEVSVVQLVDDPDDDADWMLDAYHKAAEARHIWGRCLKSGRWPGYPEQVAVIEAPHWHRSKWAEREAQAPAPSRETLAMATAWQGPERMKA